MSIKSASWIVLLLSLFLNCQSASDQNAESSDLSKLFSKGYKIIDLTHPLNNTSPFWPNSDNTSPFEYQIIASHESGAASLGMYRTAEHFGTHIDAPIHFKDSTSTVDQIDVQDLFSPLALIDVKAKCETNSDYLLSVDDILEWENSHGEIPRGSVVIMKTGWGKKWKDMTAYRNQDANGKMHFPGFSVEVNEFLVNSRDISGIGIDNLSIDYGLSNNFQAHGVTNGAGKYHLENLADLTGVPESGAFLVVAPVKIEGGSGGQVRVFAIIP